MSTTTKTTKNDTSLAGMVHSDREASIRAIETAILEKGGNPRGIFERFRTDPRFSARLAAFALRGGIDLPADLRTVRLLMGQNFFGPEEWASFYNESLPAKFLRKIKFPWGEDVLEGPCPFNSGKTVRETHVAFLGLSVLGDKPLTILRWQELHPKSSGKQPFFYHDPNPWYAEESHARVALQARWHLFLREVVPGSVGIDHEAQIKLLPSEYEVPTTVAEVTKDLLSFRKSGTRPNQNIWARCSERTSNGLLSVAGDWGGSGLLVYWGGNADDIVGMGASRKLPSKTA